MFHFGPHVISHVFVRWLFSFTDVQVCLFLTALGCVDCSSCVWMCSLLSAPVSVLKNTLMRCLLDFHQVKYPDEQKEKGHSFGDHNVHIGDRKDRWFKKGGNEAIYVKIEKPVCQN